MENSTEITFNNMPSAVAKVYNVVNEITKQLAEIKKSFEPKKPTEYLTRSEVAELLKCNESTVHNWTKKGKLVKHCIGNRSYYKRSEVEAAIITIGKGVQL
jgi:excisionase family DNA binding protein